MGVQNLWMLLAPVGRQIEIEALSNQILAVDASIWLTQFIKAMRDDEGNMIKNAHLIGTFHRVAKLLFYRIRPVFVFDGNTPEIKKRTVARRRKRQEYQAANLRQTAQRILLNRLKLYREELKKNGGKPVLNPAVDPSFFIPEAATANATVEESKDNDGDDAVITIDESEDDVASGEDTSSIVDELVTDANLEESKHDDSDDEHDEDELSVDDIQLDTSHLSRIDLDAVFALPPHLQKEMVERIQRDRRQEARNLFIPLAGNPEAYSRTQIASFLKTSSLNSSLAKARQKSVQEQMKKSAIENGEAKDDETALLGHGKRIASSSDRFYIYEKAKKRPRDQDGDQDDTNAEENVVNPFTDNAFLEASALREAASSEDEEDIFDRIHGAKRKRHNLDEDKVVVKTSLSDFSAAAVDDFVAEMGRSQRRKMAVEARRQEFLEKQRVKDEEKLVKEAVNDIQLKEGVVYPAPVPSLRGGITITLKKEDLIALDRKAQELFPVSLFATSEDSKSPIVSGENATLSSVAEDDEDDIDWEDVTPPVVASMSAPEPAKELTKAVATSHSPSATSLTPGRTAETTLVNQVIEIDDDSENGETQWEDVEPLPEPQSLPTPSTTPVVAEAKVPQEVFTLSDSELDELDEDAAELYKSLQVEMEEEKAEEDLNVLKQEAIQSAIATATNLTQWAAGAVRRALAQHTKQFDSPGKSPDKPRSTRVAPPPPRISDESIIDLSGDAAPTPASNETIIPEEAESQSEDQSLQLAIEKSIRESSTEKASGASRYLQYNAPEVEPEPQVNVAAITEEQQELKKLRNRQMRDVEGVNDEMVEDVMELLRLFGVPYLVCPMEAEAQCAALEQLGLVNGIITDDSDIFPFGGRKVYKNIFHNQKFVEAFSADDVKTELGFTQDEIISLALLLGSDYTDGVRGIGIVNASEVVAAYPGLDGLKEFKEWVMSFDVAEEARRRVEKKKSQAELDKMPPRERFEYTHANARRKWELGEEFPNDRVIQAYKSPQVDRSEGRFSWELPDLAGLRDYCTRVFGWDQAKADTALLPLMEQIASFANNRQVQTRIDQFFTKYEDNVKYAKIQSKRLRSAVEGKTGKKTETATENDTEENQTAQSPRRVVKKGKFTKTKKTTSTLGL